MKLYLDVSWVFIGFISGRLQFLANPGFDLIHVSAELLQSLRLTQLRAFLNHLGLQAAPPEGKIFTFTPSHSLLHQNYADQ